MSYYEKKVESLDFRPKYYNENPIELVETNILEDHLSVTGIPIRSYENGKVICTNELQNVLGIGSSGSGKTTCLSIPYTLMNIKADNSFVCVDTKGEIYRKTSALAKSRDYNIYVINFSNFKKSNCYNPHAYAEYLYNSGREDDAYKEIKVITDMFKETQVKDVFWENSSSDMNTALGYMCLKETNHLNPALLYKCFTIITSLKGSRYNGNSLKKVIKALNDENIESLISSYSEGPTDTAASIAVTASEKLSNWTISNTLINMTCKNDLPFDDLSDPNKKIAIYVILSDSNTTFHKLSGILVKQILSKIEDDADEIYHGKLPKKFSFILEEAGQYEIKELPSIVSASRSRNIEILLIVQSIAQLKSKYGDDGCNTILDNIMIYSYMYCKDQETLNLISKLSGTRYSYRNQHLESVARITENDLLCLPFGKSVTVLNRKKAFYSDLCPYFKMNLDLKDNYDYPDMKDYSFEILMQRQLLEKKINELRGE